MARKYDFISELYNRTCKTVVANPASWEAFLRSACYNYRLRFDEQLLVHAQRPDATAVLQIDDWNQKFGRWVNRGAHGIAVFEDADQRRQRLVHYFDISDTHPSRFSRRVPIWQMRDEYTAEVIDTLESTFGELNDKETLAVAIESAARNAVEDNIPDYLTDLLYSVKDSFLDGVSEEEITHIFKTAVRNSVAYMTMTRLGIEAGEYFEPEDLRDVVNFTTPATLNALGYLHIHIGEQDIVCTRQTVHQLFNLAVHMGKLHLQGGDFRVCLCRFLSACQSLVACQFLYHLLINNSFQFRSNDFPAPRTTLVMAGRSARRCWQWRRPRCSAVSWACWAARTVLRWRLRRCWSSAPASAWAASRRCRKSTTGACFNGPRFFCVGLLSERVEA